MLRQRRNVRTDSHPLRPDSTHLDLPSPSCRFMADRKSRWGKVVSGRARKMAITVCRSPTDVGVTEIARSPEVLPNGRLSSPRISILDRLIKSCPVWLQLCMSARRAAAILSQEESGVFLVTRDVGAKCMVLWVHISERRDPADVLRYNVREEKTMMNLDGSFLVFEDIFKLVGFYCVSRDILPSPLRLPYAIAQACSLKELEVFSNLGTGFWDSSMTDRRGSPTSPPGKVSSCGHARHGDVGLQPESACSCEIELSVGGDKLWFVNPIFIEECGNTQNSSGLPPFANCVAKAEGPLPKVVYRRPPPPPPPPSLRKPPLPSVPPSAPPPNYIPQMHSPPICFSAQTPPVSSNSSEASILLSKPEHPSLLSVEEPTSRCSQTNLPSAEGSLVFAVDTFPEDPDSSTSLDPNPPVLKPVAPSVDLLSLVSSEILCTESTTVPSELPANSPPKDTSSAFVCQTDISSTPQNLNQEDFGWTILDVCASFIAQDLNLAYDSAEGFNDISSSTSPNLTEDSEGRSVDFSSSAAQHLNQAEDYLGTCTDFSSTPPNLNKAVDSSGKFDVSSSSYTRQNLKESEDFSGTSAAPISPPPNPSGVKVSVGNSRDVSSYSSIPPNLNQAKDSERSVIVPLKSSAEMKINNVEDKKDGAVNDIPQLRTPVRPPPAVPKRRQSGKIPEDAAAVMYVIEDPAGGTCPASPPHKQVATEVDPSLVEHVESHVSSNRGLKGKTVVSPRLQHKAPETCKKQAPVPPPRVKKLSSRHSSVDSSQEKSETPEHLKTSAIQSANNVKIRDKKDHQRRSLQAKAHKGLDSSPKSPRSGLNSQLSNPEADSYSTSSADEDRERMTRSPLKKSHSFMLDRAKNRLSIMSFTNVLSAFMSADRKLQKRIVELAQDKDTYFGNLVQDYKAYSLEMMAKQRSSTEMLQELRLMMTQLKSYLVQSAELKSIVDYNLYDDDKIDSIAEAALCKCVLKPLKSPIEIYLREIHGKDGALRLLTENQLVIQDTTTTDLGVTTSVPDSAIMEKIIHKFGVMHKTYSPEKKITYLLKACKLIYDSMATGNPGKPHGADDFLPVLMYVLARCDLAALLLDVEYMMELMDPALQLGEGSYYLTTTYGALEHIKNYDKITVTRQLSMEVQDSIHRWERRRTLNKAKVSRSSIQDFITVSFEELGANTRTLATKPDTRVTQVLQQCAEKFGVSDPQQHGLFVLVSDRSYRLAEDASPQQVKSQLLKHEQKPDFHFVYKRAGQQDTVLKELDFSVALTGAL